ncbi:hypothetical protein AAB984_36695 [Burkholderia contaminans]|uniref:hypothetical protein n=1 Tax=Burkholderia contaminans TaxID=488447 RepID=UPI002415ECB3|nr:hypothetical protein [Burkholderia contaminans]WFN14846.1 hypothetical protein LXE92_31785 [Burkholderia contaminans]
MAGPEAGHETHERVDEMNNAFSYANRRGDQAVPHGVLEIASYLKRSLDEHLDEATAAESLAAYQRGFDHIYRQPGAHTGLDIKKALTDVRERHDDVSEQAEQLGRLHGCLASLYRQALV